MAHAKLVDSMTAAEFLAWERGQLDKHEFHDGQVFAMAGGSPRHNALCFALTGRLDRERRTTGCRGFTSDQKVSCPDANKSHYVYPDATVLCESFEVAPGTTDVLANPTIVCEVLSKSTADYDQGDKWLGYQRLPSLLEYVLVEQATKRVKVFRRSSGQAGSWLYTSYGNGEIVSLESGITLDVDALYDGVFELLGDD